MSVSRAWRECINIYVELCALKRLVMQGKMHVYYGRTTTDQFHDVPQVQTLMYAQDED